MRGGAAVSAAPTLSPTDTEAFMQDEFWREPRFTFEERRQQYLAYCAAQSPGGRNWFLQPDCSARVGATCG